MKPLKTPLSWEELHQELRERLAKKPRFKAELRDFWMNTTGMGCVRDVVMATFEGTVDEFMTQLGQWMKEQLKHEFCTEDQWQTHFKLSKIGLIFKKLCVDLKWGYQFAASSQGYYVKIL